MAAIDLIVLGMIKQQPQSAYELQKMSTGTYPAG